MYRLKIYTMMWTRTKTTDPTKIVHWGLVQCTFARYDTIILKVSFSMDSPAHCTSVQFINKI